jgi:hypothetical protein
MRNFLTYLKHFYSLKQKDLTPLALESWREYIKGKKPIYDMDFCRAYQRGYISQYRHNYAMAKINNA